MASLILRGLRRGEHSDISSYIITDLMATYFEVFSFMNKSLWLNLLGFDSIHVNTDRDWEITASYWQKSWIFHKMGFKAILFIRAQFCNADTTNVCLLVIHLVS